MTDIFTLAQIETELQKRLVYPYRWGKVQNQMDDKLTNFVYSILYFEDVLAEIERNFKQKSAEEYQILFNYTLNRWYNFWSAMAVEKIFASFPTVKTIENPQHHFVDFEIKGIPFDHKSTIFPKNYPETFEFARRNPDNLVTWLYQNQSQENRKHLKNRLFIVFYSSDAEHWQLKAKITWLETIIERYLHTFNFSQLIHIQIVPHTTVLTDVIWAIA